MNKDPQAKSSDLTETAETSSPARRKWSIAEITEKLIADPDQTPEDIAHFLKVHSFARLIAGLEGLDAATKEILEVTAILHDISCPLCREKYGNTNGEHQEAESAPLIRAFLTGSGYTKSFVDRVVYLVTHHHTYKDIHDMDYQILVEADFLVNAGESAKYRKLLPEMRTRIFRTESGRRLLEEIYPE